MCCWTRTSWQWFHMRRRTHPPNEPTTKRTSKRTSNLSVFCPLNHTALKANVRRSRTSASVREVKVRGGHFTDFIARGGLRFCPPENIHAIIFIFKCRTTVRLGHVFGWQLFAKSVDVRQNFTTDLESDWLFRLNGYFVLYCVYTESINTESTSSDYTAYTESLNNTYIVCSGWYLRPTPPGWVIF